MPAIEVTSISKRFRYPAIGRHATLKETLVNRFLLDKHEQRVVDALVDVSFTLDRGEMLGVVGRNGCGKTTMLRLLAGIFRPDSGKIAIRGTLAPLLGLGTAFHPDLTGRENARIELLVLGCKPREIARRIDDIAAFAEIGEFIDAPVRTFSAGMAMRLAFSVAMNVDPDILLLDEILAVGDQAFAKKCLSCIDDFKRQGKTIVLVTHDGRTVVERCDKGLWLEHGRVRGFGEPLAVVNDYYRSMVERGEAQPVAV